MNWLRETIESGLSPEAKESCIEREYKGIYLDKLETLLEVADEGYKGTLGGTAVTLALYEEVRTLRAELEAGL